MDSFISPPLLYFVIFFAKLLEVTFSTIRVVLTARGNRIIATLLASVEITIWLLVASTVLSGIAHDPLRAVAYGIAYASGIYTGIFLEDKLALGLAQIEIIAEHDLAMTIAARFREKKYGLTTFECEGLEGKKLSLVLKVHRKDVPLSIGLLKEYPDLFVSVTDIRKLSKGKIERH